MKRNNTVILLILANCIVSLFTVAQNPIYGNEKMVTINGYSLDAMEPHLHTNDSAIFFNSLNDGINTSLLYCLRVNDTTFNLVNFVPAVNQTVTPRLDAVASIDTMDNFYWVSTRGYPSNFDNLHRVRFLPSSYTNFGRVHGDFYIYQPGYLIMDAAVSYFGDKLVYCNAYFNNCGSIPCDASMGIALKVNDSVFNKHPNTNTIMASINDTANYCVYAPNLTKDELELFYSRFHKSAFNTEILVATRSSTNGVFGAPSILVSAPGFVPEAPTLTADKTKMYFHKKVGGIYKLFVRYRLGVTGTNEKEKEYETLAFPNPASSILNLGSGIISIELVNILGETVYSKSDHSEIKQIDISELENGIYFLNCNGKYAQKIVIAH